MKISDYSKSTWAQFISHPSQKNAVKAKFESYTLGCSQEISTVYGKCRLSRHILSSPARGGRIFLPIH